MPAPSSPLFPTPAVRHWSHSGLSARHEQRFNWIATGIIVLFVAAWVGAIVDTRRRYREAKLREALTGVPAPSALSPTHQISASLLDPRAPTTAFMNEAMLSYVDPLRGQSGKLRFATRTPGATIVPDVPREASAVLTEKDEPVVTPFTAPEKPGVYKMAVKIDEAMRAIEGISIITLVPFQQKKRGKIGLYYLGSWPYEEGGKPRTASYAPPSGFIEVTRENQDTYVSDHFRLRDFLTKDQREVWPKYLLLNPKLIDKLELAIAELEARGIRVKHMQVMSGFRTPRYNHSGGNVAGRANLSRHMYGDAADVFVDNDRNGMMDDINGDGRVTVRDAEVLSQAVERVERAHPSLVGGIGVYSACCGHGPFTHVDVRGLRARWRGSGNG